MRVPPLAEVLVFGGGPAGAVCAIALADIGRNVVLCEATRFPRQHVGISFSPGVQKQLAFLELQHLLEPSDHLRGLAVKQRWGTSTFDMAPHQEGFVADRGRFDLDLLSEAAKRGVLVLQPARAGRPRREPDGWAVDIDHPAGSVAMRARFIIDATGRSSAFRRRRRVGAATVAISGRLRCPGHHGIRLSAAADSWGWSAPTATCERVVVVFTDPDHLRNLGGSLEQQHLRLIMATGLASPDIDTARDLKAYDATPYVTLGIQDGLLRIGDADAALDPLSSSGVQAAIQSGMAAMPVINTLLTTDGDHLAAWRFWQARRLRGALTHRRWARSLYAEAFAHHPTAFWARRARKHEVPADVARAPLPDPTQPMRISPDAHFVMAPCVVGTTIERSACLTHPSLGEPVGFVGGSALDALLREFQDVANANDLVVRWAKETSGPQALQLLAWLWRRRILIPS